MLRKSSLDEPPIPDKVLLDVEYLQRRSFGFDLRILWLTVVRVVTREGVAHYSSYVPSHPHMAQIVCTAEAQRWLEDIFGYIAGDN